jgi:predicted NAD/FAD-binding protein
VYFFERHFLVNLQHMITPPPRIAIVGSGIAGLGAAWMLAQAAADVTVFESRSEAGFDSLSVDIAAGDGIVRADVPSRMFNSTEWPNLARLYDHLGIESEMVDASQSFGTAGENAWLTTEDARRPAKALAFLTDARSRSIARDLRRLLAEARTDVDTGNVTGSLGDYLRIRNYGGDFLYRFLYPTLSSTVCTCTYHALDQYPARLLLGTLRNIVDDRMLQRVRGGASCVVKALLNAPIRLRRNTTIARVIPGGNGVQVQESGGRLHEFDHVILAIQSDQARQLVERLPADEVAVLESFQYEPVQVVVHSDARWMPRRIQDWKTFNMISQPDLKGACCSVWLNRFHRNWPTAISPCFETIWAGNPGEYAIDDEKILRRVSMQRVIVTAKNLDAWQALHAIHERADRRLWYCGSWAAPGTPLLESGLVSARFAVERIAGCSPLPRIESSADYCSRS